jgi:hypothetical protein
MRFASVWALAIALIIMVTVAACDNEPTSPTSLGSPATTAAASSAPTTATTAADSSSSTTATTAAGSGGSTAAIDPADFSTTVDHPYFPLEPGSSLIYEGSSEDGATRVTVTVLFETKVVMGVECRVVLDEVIVVDELRESTRDWYAQDDDGNVWYFGEDTKEYEDGEVTSTAGSWEAGVDGAVPGIIMKADPAVGDVYQQEYLAGEAEDMAEGLEVDATVQVPYGSFDSVVKTKDWTPLEPGVVEEKYYAPGMGLVLTKQVEGGSEWERLIDLFGL